MRLIINLDGAFEIPYDHSYLLYSAVLSAMKNIDQDLVSQIHNNSRSPKYCMSQLLPGGKRNFTKSGLRAERFIFLISSLNSEILEKIKSGIEKQKFITIGNSKLPVHSTILENPPITSGIVNMISRSPIVLKNEGKYITARDPDFSRVLENNIAAKYMKVRGGSPRIRFLRITDTKVKLSNLKGVGIPSSMVAFTISADYDLIEFIVNVGVGAKTQMGFGFIEEQKKGVDNDF